MGGRRAPSMPLSAPSATSLPWEASAADRQVLATAPDWSALSGLEQLWPALAERHGEATALEAPHARPPETLSYRQLAGAIEQAAAGFRALGVTEGDVVALFAENGPRWLVADQGLMRAGAADAVRGATAPAEELRYILSDCGAVGLVVESQALLQRLELAPAATARLRFIVLLEDASEAPNATAAAPRSNDTAASATVANDTVASDIASSSTTSSATAAATSSSRTVASGTTSSDTLSSDTVSGSAVSGSAVSGGPVSADGTSIATVNHTVSETINDTVPTATASSSSTIFPGATVSSATVSSSGAKAPRAKASSVATAPTTAPTPTASAASEAAPAPSAAAAPVCLSWSQLLQRGRSAAVAPQPSGGPDRLATLLYTSGTTGTPKGVPLTHANLLHQLRTLGVAVQPHPGERVLSVLPIWHAYERSAEYFLFSRGCRQTYTNLRQLRADLQKVRPQYLISVPRLWEALMAGFEEALAAMPSSRRKLLQAALSNSRAWALADRTARDQTLTPEPLPRRLTARLKATLRWPLHRLAATLLWPKVRQQLVGGALRRAISGGGALALHVDGFFEAIGIELLVGYGLTETSPVLTCRRTWCNRRGSAGQPLPGTTIRIVDPHTRQPLPIAERGLVLARGPQVMGGYFGKPEATAKVLDGEGWFDTGDLGRLLQDGSLVLTGRAKDTIVLSSGENIEPGPLEEVLLESPLVEQVMLVGQDRKQLGALLVPRAEALAAYASAEGLPAPVGSDPTKRNGDEGGTWRAEPALLRSLTRQFNRLLAERPGSRPDERLAGVALVAPFTIENGLLTQTLKQRRDRIAERDATAIAQLYGEGSGG